MASSRRSFLRSSVVLAGMGAMPSMFFTSCLPWREGQELAVDYIGSQEKFEFYQHYFKKLKRNQFALSSLEAAISNDSNIVFLDTDSDNKSSYAIVLLEQGKDIITSYPLGNTLTEYASISEFAEKYARMVGMLNPLAFYPSVERLREIISSKSISLKLVRITCHPSDLSTEFRVAGPTGAAQPLQRIVSYLSDSYPESLLAESDGNGELARIRIKFKNLEALILFDREQYGWNMELTGSGFSAIIDHTGLLALDGEIEPRLLPDPAVMEKALKANIEDFMQSVRERSVSRVNILDGLASIILNKAVEESLKTASIVRL